MSDTALVIIARYPEAGKTKTRLARAIGDEEASNLYRAFLVDLATRFTRQDWHVYWTYTPPEVDYSSFVSTLIPPAQHNIPVFCFAQQGASLGERLLYAFHWTRNHAYSYTVLISSDSPHIPVETVAQARAALENADVVLGPAEDGGYYLIAMRQPYDLFSGIPMSTSQVLEMTIALAHSQDLSVRLLEPLFDIDERADLLRLAQLLEADSTLAPATAARLATLRSNLHDYDIHHHSSTFDLH